jgi:lysyl-tRNA synthetase class II
MAETLSEQEANRRASLQKIRDLGIEPFPAAEFPVDATSKAIAASFKDDAPQQDVCIAGRVMGIRIMGKAAFAVLRDGEETNRSTSVVTTSRPARTRRCTMTSSRSTSTSATLLA